MTLSFIVFAAISDAVKESKSSFNRAFSANELLLIAMIGGGIALAIIIWAVFFRKRPDEIRHPIPQSRRSEEEDDEEREDGRVRRRRRRRKRPHRPRNATLSETGGLPPKRPEDEPPPY